MSRGGWLVVCLFGSALALMPQAAWSLPLELNEARLWMGESVTAPDFTDAPRVSFPDYWGIQRRLQATGGWYEVQVTLPQMNAADPARPLALFMPNSSGVLEVYWDGEYVGGSVPLTGAGVPIVSGPLLVTLPRSIATPGQHRVHIRFTGNAASINFVRAPVIGDEKVLGERFARKKLTLVYLPLLLGGFSIVSALLFFGAYRNDPAAPGVNYLTAGLVAASWSVLGLYLSLPESAAAFTDRLRPLMFHLSFVFFLLAMNEIRGQSNRYARALGWVAAGFAVAIMLVPMPRVYQVAVLWSPITYTVGIWLFVLVVKMALAPPRRWLILAAFGSVPLFLAHDIIGVVRGGDYLADQLLGVFNPPLYAFALLMVLISRARMHVETVLTLNAELEDRVAAKHAQLQENYARMAAAERREAVLSERQRVVRDMHDGLGNQLVSTLAMVESRRYAPEELEAALRDSLDDMRMMVHSLDRDETDLVEILALVRERVEPRLTRQGLRFRWRVDDVPGTANLNPQTAGHILRIVQEALTNVIKHANAQTITLSTGVRAGKRFISIEDDGDGFDPQADSSGGRGLMNMRERAAQIEAEVDVHCGGKGQGAVITLWLDPVTPASTPAPMSTAAPTSVPTKREH